MMPRYIFFLNFLRKKIPKRLFKIRSIFHYSSFLDFFLKIAFRFFVKMEIVVVEYFSRFDSLLNNHATDITIVRRTVRLIELVMEKDLFDFLCWLVSDNERELYFSRNCAIKFIHCQAKNELLKVEESHLII